MSYEREVTVNNRTLPKCDCAAVLRSKLSTRFLKVPVPQMCLKRNVGEVWKQVLKLLF